MTENFQKKIIFFCSYDNTTGIFTVPSGGDGVYYFSTFLLVSPGEGGRFEMRLNDNVVCTAFGDQDYSGVDHAQGGCGAMLSVVEGKSTRKFGGSRGLRFHEVF